MRPRISRRVSRLRSILITGAALLFLQLIGCSSVKLETYRRPYHDFSAYGTIAILPVSIPGKDTDDKEGAQVVTALIAARMIKEKYDVIDADTAVARLRQAGIQADGASDVTLLQKAAEALGVKAILTGDLSYYGPFDFDVPPRQVPYETWDWYGYPRRGYYYQPGYTETGSRAALKLKLFDAPLGTYVWWAEGDRAGSERIAQHYAEQIIDKALEKFPVKPPDKKKDKKKKNEDKN